MVVAFLTIPRVPGSARQQHVREQIAISGVVAETVVVPDWKSGKPAPVGMMAATDNRKVMSRHKAMVLTKLIDRSTPRLHEMMRNGDVVDDVVLNFWRMPPGGGIEQNFYRIMMSGVQVAGLRLLMPNNRFPANELVPEQEELLLTYTTVLYIFDTSPTRSANGGGGTDPTESEKTNGITAAFEPPNEALAKQLAIDSGKWAAEQAASPIYGLLKKAIEERAKLGADVIPKLPGK